jgi:DnaJ family protein A protein 5
MGAGQSSGRGEAEVEIKTSYYELLGVARQATDDEIKKAYRRKALELHPDRNYGNEENATRTFADVQAAYEVLSDPQERAWYDSHESAILRGDDGQGGNDTPSYQNVPITTADDLARLVRKFNSNVEFSDAPSGFYGFLRSTFEQLAKEESIAAAWENLPEPEYPTFGHKDDTYDPVVKSFYAAWSPFSTVKTFAWKDKYKLSDAPDRWFRRRMEKENKAFRQEGIKEFNDAVRALVAFVRKRDPRHTPTTQSEADRQKVLREAAAAQAARARAANQVKVENAVPEWAQSRAPEPDEGDFEDEEEEEQEIFECVACNKIFKSERQWEAHEKSKKHQKSVYALRKKMRKQNAHLDLDDGSQFSSSGVATPDAEDEEEEEEVSTDVVAGVGDYDNETNGIQREPSDEEILNDEGSENDEDAAPHQQPSQLANEELSDSDNSDYASTETVRARLASTSMSTPATTVSETGEADEQAQPKPNEEDGTGEPAKPKMGKAAQKRAKKAAAAAEAEAEVPSNNHNCATCNVSFPSRTQLFQHITKNKHAALKSVSAGTGTGGKGKKAKGKK